MFEQFKYGNITETGSASSINEDYYGCFDTPNGKVFVVCDGLSNPIGGHVASKVAVEAVREYYNLTAYNNLIISLQNALVHANNAVVAKIQTEPELAGMTTTCLIVIIKESRVFYASVGDTRLYHFRTGKCALIAGNVNPGEINSEENKTRILGSNAAITSYVCNEPLIPSAGDLLLLCSAGLTDVLVENFSLPIIYKNQELQIRVADLARLADKNQTADNTTLQLIEFEGDKIGMAPIVLNTAEKVTVDYIVKGPGRPVVLPIILLLLIAAVIYFGSRHFNKDNSETVITETTTDSAVSKKAEIAVEKSQDKSLTTTQFDTEIDSAKYAPKGHHPQLPPVNSGVSFESGSPQTVEIPQQSSGHIFSGSGEAYIYTLQQGDNAIGLKNRFGKTWEQLKSEDPNYTEALPQPGKEIKIYGYIFFASGSERERNENIENALKSTPGLKRSQIIMVPDGILIP